MSAPSLLQAIDTTWMKFRAFVLDSLRSMGVPEIKLEEVGTLLNANALVYLPHIKEFVNKHGRMILAREKNYFRALVPEEWKHLEISDKIAEKGLDFGAVFCYIIKELQE